MMDTNMLEDLRQRAMRIRQDRFGDQFAADALNAAADELEKLRGALLAMAQAWSRESGIAWTTIVSHYGVSVAELRNAA